MLLTYSIVALLSVCAWLYIRWTRVRRFWKDRNVPHLPPHPVMGSLTFLQKENTAIWMRELSERFRSPYIGIWLFWRPGLIVNSPEYARNILVKDSEVFRDRFLSSGSNDPIGHLNLFTVNDPLWSFLRRQITGVFTAAKLRGFHGLIFKKALELVQRVRNDVKEKKSIDLRSLYSDYTTDIIGTTAFGVTNDATLTGDSAFREVTKEFMKFSVFRGLAWTCIFFFPELVNIFGYTFFPKPTTDFFVKVFQTIVSQRGGYDKEIYEMKDLVDALIKIKQDAAKKGEDVSEETLIAQAIIFIQGGFDTSAVILTYATYELAFQPHLQEKLYNELVEAKQNIGSSEFDSNTLAELTYLNCVIKETLRKYPPMGWLDRIASKDYIIDDNLTIPKGTPVYVNAYGMHYNPAYFPDPEKFDPDRFLPENEKNIKPFTYMPFGEGPRNCVGKRFAYQTVRNGLAHIALNFKFHPLPNSSKPTECEVEKRGMFLMPGQVLKVNIEPRE